MEKMSKVLIAEGLARALAMALASASAIRVGLDAETKTVIFMERRASVKDLPALWVLSVVAAVAAGYQFLQLCRCLALALIRKNQCKCSKLFLWVCLLSDQAMSYATFASSLAAAQGSLVALTGMKQMQWQKLCNIYTKFCVQAAVGIAMGALSSIVMILITSLSAYNLFRLYPSKRRSFSRVAR